MASLISAGTPTILAENFRGSTQPFQKVVRIVSLDGPLSLPTTAFQMYHYHWTLYMQNYWQRH
jgi:hypothetical protein